jgi:hypothetical protein
MPDYCHSPLNASPIDVTMKNAGKLFGKFGGKFQSGFGGIIGKFGGGAINFGSKIGNRLNNFGNDVGDTGRKIGNGIVDTGILVYIIITLFSKCKLK